MTAFINSPTTPNMIYLDHHATTPVIPEVLQAMLPWMTENFGNPHSTSHIFGRKSSQACSEAIDLIANELEADPSSVIITSCASESNNLAITGTMLHPRQKRRHVITAPTEHPSVLRPIRALKRRGFRVSELPVRQQGDNFCGLVDPEDLRALINDDTALVSIMWANNEIGSIQPIPELASIAHQYGAIFHTDATQAVGKVPVSIKAAECDLLSGSAHKFYGPKGVGFLCIRSEHNRVRLTPMILGGDQQSGLRAGTMNCPGLIGMATALKICNRDLSTETTRLANLRNQLWMKLDNRLPGIELNGPFLDQQVRLAGNLNISLPGMESETIISASEDLAVSTGTACSSLDPKPSHVLTSIGLDETRARRSLRFGLGRGTTVRTIEEAVELLCQAHRRILESDLKKSLNN